MRRRQLLALTLPSLLCGINQIRAHTPANQLTVQRGTSQMCTNAGNNQTTAGNKAEAWPGNGQANQQWTPG
jgi:hypothetical protein